MALMATMQRLVEAAELERGVVGAALGHAAGQDLPDDRPHPFLRHPFPRRDLGDRDAVVQQVDDAPFPDGLFDARGATGLDRAIAGLGGKRKRGGFGHAAMFLLMISTMSTFIEQNAAAGKEKSCSLRVPRAPLFRRRPPASVPREPDCPCGEFAGQVSEASSGWRRSSPCRPTAPCRRGSGNDSRAAGTEARLSSIRPFQCPSAGNRRLCRARAPPQSARRHRRSSRRNSGPPDAALSRTGRRP